jgi:hypothetical protein
MAIRPVSRPWRKFKGVIATPACQNTHFVGHLTRVSWREGEPIHSTQVGADARKAQATYVLRMTSDSGVGGSATHGNILLRTISTGAPQQVHSSCGRGVEILGALRGSLNTSNFNSEIIRLLLGCKNPKLRERRNPLGNTCCNTSQRNAAPRSVRSIIFFGVTVAESVSDLPALATHDVALVNHAPVAVCEGLIEGRGADGAPYAAARCANAHSMCS